MDNYDARMASVYRSILRKRKNLSPRMERMLSEIKKAGKVHWSAISGYRACGTFNALRWRLLVRDEKIDGDIYYVASSMTDEQIQAYIDMHSRRAK